MATADLEGTAEELDVNEAMMNARSDQARQAIQRGHLYRIRMKVRDQFLPRARARLAMLLPLKAADRKLLEDARKAAEANVKAVTGG